MDNTIDFGIVCIKGNSGNALKVTANTFNNKRYLHIREYMLDGDTGKLFPTKTGVSMDPNELDSLIEILDNANKVLNKSLHYRNQLSFDFNKKDE